MIMVWGQGPYLAIIVAWDPGPYIAIIMVWCQGICVATAMICDLRPSLVIIIGLCRDTNLPL
jgi:hypothetical protein